MTQLEFPVIGAKWTIGILGLFHTSVASMAIGFAFFVTVAQIVGYIKKERQYDLLAKRIQLIHVCLYNIGTISAIGLVFALSGLYPQFWSQIFVQFFWPMIVEEFLFFFLATTLTFHYFFWDRLWGHKKLHIFLGAMLTPLFFFQFYIINGMGGFMMTPGVGEAELSLRTGLLGWDKIGFYNPSFLMLTAHRFLANIAYGSFAVAGICGVMLYLISRPRVKEFYEEGGRLAFYIGFIAFLFLPIVGYFYAQVLKTHANTAYVNLMFGKGDVVKAGIDWWWLKHIFVASMLGIGLTYFKRTAKAGKLFSLPTVIIYSVSAMYFLFYFVMGKIMTWSFFLYTLTFAIGGGALAWHLLTYHRGSGRAVYWLVAILSFATVMLGGYAREASRPRFVDRIAAYDKVFIPEERQPYLMLPLKPGDLPEKKVIRITEPEALIATKCSRCHTLDRVRSYSKDDWELLLGRMKIFGLKVTEQETAIIIGHLRARKPF